MRVTIDTPRGGGAMLGSDVVSVPGRDRSSGAGAGPRIERHARDVSFTPSIAPIHKPPCTLGLSNPTLADPCPLELFPFDLITTPCPQKLNTN